ncbi:unnamed protein product [Adineta steineri]|uniref:Uncharacterized protein n=1 Tax=Adineta steineri TaxID=433720 RepID=A0A818VUQ2_9BILA|nr:unnamed protein product [Adineta steineri]CAF3716121.1 unnamed protein product [Adineta steineri]
MASTEELNTNETTSSRRIIRFCERIVNIFQLNLNGTEDLKKTSLGRLNFTNTSKLDVKLPFNKHFSKSIPKLYQLTSLNVQLTTDYTNQSDLRVLLEQAPNLHTLSVLCPTKTTLKYFLAVINNPSILKLNLPKAVSLTDAQAENLRTLSQYCIQDGDTSLKYHLETSDKNATYIYKTTQSDLISIIDNLIVRQADIILEKRFHISYFYNLVNIAGVEQTSLCISYVLKDQIHEKILMYISVKDRTGPRLGKLIIKSIIDLGMD